MVRQIYQDDKKQTKSFNYLTILQNVQILLLNDYPHKINDKKSYKNMFFYIFEQILYFNLVIAYSLK